VITVDFNRLSIRPGHRILDIGCGTGRHTCAAYSEHACQYRTYETYEYRA